MLEKAFQEDILQIRKISQSDIRELANIMVEVYNAPPWNDSWTEKTASDSLVTLLAYPDFCGNIIADGDKIIGAIIGNIRKYARDTTYYINEFFILDKYWRRGVATSLYTYTIEELKKCGVNGAFFTTLKNTPAYSFYTKQGAWDLTDSACFYHKF